ncbi:MAG: site-2 protease family protein [Candidatus Omnitrophota bacterium]|jgi:Zn-dependent protease|nr:MAG: site-2 protease family protein [Candidatus Omnitrophota bacterium]
MLLTFLISFAILIPAMTIHEFSHGWVAYKLGDPTAKYSGRLTLNPLAHIDPIGTILLPLMLFISTQGRFVFGAAKPVPINFMALRNPKRDIIWVGASGPLSNLLLAFLFSFILKLLPMPDILSIIISQFVLINVVLGIFNLIPIPPLDGSRIIMGLLPNQLSEKYAQIEPFGFIIIIALIWMGILNILVWPVVYLVLGLLGIGI